MHFHTYLNKSAPWGSLKIIYKILLLELFHHFCRPKFGHFVTLYAQRNKTKNEPINFTVILSRISHEEGLNKDWAGKEIT